MPLSEIGLSMMQNKKPSSSVQGVIDAVPQTKNVQSQVPSDIAYGKSLVERASPYAEKAKVALTGFAQKQIETLVSPVTEGVIPTPLDVAEGTLKVQKGIFKGAVAAAEGLNEGFARIVKSTSEAVVGREATDKIGSNPFVKKFTESITGREGQAPMMTYKDIHRVIYDDAVEHGATPKTAATTATLGVLGMLFIDNPAVGPGKKLPVKMIDELVAANTDEAVETVLKTNLPGITKEEIQAVTPSLTKAKTQESVQEIFDTIGKAKADIGETIGVKTTDDVLTDPTFLKKENKQALIDVIKTSDEAKVFKERYKAEVDAKPFQRAQAMKLFDELIAELPTAKSIADKEFITKKDLSEGFKQADYEVTTEMEELSNAGYRVINDDEVRGVPSTFPQWVPDHLRSNELFSKAIEHYEAGTVPAENATNVRELLTVMKEEISKRSAKYNEEFATALQSGTLDDFAEDSLPPTQVDTVPEIGGVAPRNTNKQPLEKSLSSAKTVPQKMKTIFTDFIEYIQNSETRVLDLVNDKNLKLDLSTDPYQIMTLYHGKVGDLIEKGFTKAEIIADDIVRYTGRRKESVQQGRQLVNDYLQALHAPERNAVLGDGAAGMTDEVAAEIVKNTPKRIQEIAQKALDLNRQTLDLLHDSGVIGDELYDSLRTTYKNHVPLQRVMDEVDDVGAVMSARGFDVRSTGLKGAKGSERETLDILGNIENNYEQAVLRSEKNIVDNATLSFVRKNQDELSHLMEIQAPATVGKSFDDKAIFERTQDPTILQMYEKGKPVWIKFKDQKLAIAFRGVGREKLPTLLQWISAVTRFYSGLATRFNPEFALPNKIRDLQETMTYMASQGDIGFKGAAKTAIKDPESIKSIVEYLSGFETSGAALYAEMKAGGGTTGGMGLSTRKQTQINIDNIFKTARSRPRQATQKLIEYVDNWNTIFEDSTRLSVYKAALERGATKERAAFLAKEASINFNRMGKGGPLINGLWMFANASIQGSTKMIRAMKNPKVAASVAAVMTASVAATSEWNDQVDPEWRDKVTKWDRSNSLVVMLPTEDESTKYFVIPVSWGLKPILTMANAGYDAASGVDIDPIDTTSKLFSSILDGYNPVGGTDVTSAVAPTILDAPIEIARNQSWNGGAIRPTPYNKEPKDIQYFESLTETAQGRLAIEATKKLQESTGILISPADLNYAVDQYIGGAGRSIKKTNELLYGTATGDMPPADEFPFVSRFYRERSEEETGQGAGGEIEDLKELLSVQARENFRLSEDARAMTKTLQDLPPEVAAARFDVLTQTNPKMAEKIVDEIESEKKGLTYKDRLVKSLQVGNNERAEFIFKEIQELKSNDQKAKLWDEYTTKGLITDEVAEQISLLLAQ